MSMTPEAAVLNPEPLNTLRALHAVIQQAAQLGTPVHEVERAVWEQMLRIGRQTLQQFFTLLGSGDQGAAVVLPDDRTVERLPDLHPRRYVSIFGIFLLQRTVYGSREGQKIEFVPLDNRLQLPGSMFSYVLQDWDQALCVEQAFGQVATTVSRMLGLKQSVDSLEHMNQEMAQEATPYRLDRPTPPAAEEGPVFVASAYGKGVVLRREADAPPPPGHRTKGDKASRKRMATVGAVYSVDRYVRTPEEVVAALFRDEPQTPRASRPTPRHKHVWANLPQDNPDKLSGMEAVYVWMLWELATRNPKQAKETVYLHDGQEALWDAQARLLPAAHSVEVLDLLHVTPRVWQAAHVFHPEGSGAAEQFVRERLLRILQGKGVGVIRGLREMGTKRGLKGPKKETLRTVCGYLERNVERMHYDRCLAAGYPIASGVIEGACRHVVKDRMERAGMHWTLPGAAAMLEVRSIAVSGDWEDFQIYRIQQEAQRLYPFRALVEGPEYMMAG